MMRKVKDLEYLCQAGWLVAHSKYSLDLVVGLSYLRLFSELRRGYRPKLGPNSTGMRYEEFMAAPAGAGGGKNLGIH